MFCVTPDTRTHAVQQSRESFNSTHVYGTHAPVEEPSTASKPESWAAARLRANRVFVDIFLLDVMNPHEGLDSFDDPLGVSDQIMINIRWSEAMGEPMQ